MKNHLFRMTVLSAGLMLASHGQANETEGMKAPTAVEHSQAVLQETIKNQVQALREPLHQAIAAGQEVFENLLSCGARLDAGEIDKTHHRLCELEQGDRLLANVTSVTEIYSGFSRVYKQVGERIEQQDQQLKQRIAEDLERREKLIQEMRLDEARLPQLYEKLGSGRLSIEEQGDVEIIIHDYYTKDQLRKQYEAEIIYEKNWMERLNLYREQTQVNGTRLRVAASKTENSHTVLQTKLTMMARRSDLEFQGNELQGVLSNMVTVTSDMKRYTDSLGQLDPMLPSESPKDDDRRLPAIVGGKSKEELLKAMKVIIDRAGSR